MKTLFSRGSSRITWFMFMVALLSALCAGAATPTITTQPSSQTNVPGANISFSVTATGSGTLAYRWSFNGTNLTNSPHVGGATGTTLTITNITALDAGNYRAIVSNNQGSVTSIVATLTVYAAPAITVQPQGRIVFVGAQYSLSAAVSGPKPIAYQWLFNNSPLPNATNTTLLLTNLQLTQSGNYSLQASNTAGVAVSSNASVMVTATPDCTSPPSGLVGWWRGEGDATDVTGSNNGTLSGSGATYTNGFVGQAFCFDGTNGFVQVPDSASLRPANVTLEAWVWLDPARDTANTESIIFKKNTQTAWFEGYSLAKERHDNGDGNLVDRFVFMVSHNSSQIGIYSATVAQRGTWYHVVATFDGTTTKLYVNGTLEGTATPGFPLDYDTTPVFIGTTGTWAPYLSMFAGIIDEPSIYNRALSDAEIASIYYAGNGGKCQPPVAPIMVLQPTSKVVLAGSNTTFTAVASGVPTPSYQWYFNDVALTNDIRHGGVTGTNLSLMNVQAGDAGNYYLVATNFMGSVTSSVAVLTVGVPPSVIAQPQDQTAVAGSQVTFNLTTAGTTPMWYQLLLNGVAVPGMYGAGDTTYSFVLGGLQTNQQGTYSVLVTNSYGSAVSSNAFLTVLAPPVISQQPANQTAFLGGLALFSVVASGTAPLNYQWTFNGTSLLGATNATLLLTNLQPAQAGTYAVSVSNVVNSVTSSNATLTVIPPPPVPCIISFNPAAAIPGAAVTLTGTNFSPVASSNIVFFGATRAAVLSASATNLTVTVPSGATFGPISVTVNGLTGASKKLFEPTFIGDGSAISGTTFPASFNLSTGAGNSGGSAILADLDGDGKPDLALVAVGHVSIFRNISTNAGPLSAASFASRVDLPFPAGTGSQAYRLRAADLDGDGRQDLIACETGGNAVTTFHNIALPGNLSTNSFEPAFRLVVGNDCRFATAADLDGDGRLDIVALNYGDKTISLLQNTGAMGTLGTNSFAAPVTLAAPGGPYEVTVADLDGDGRPDLAVAMSDSGTVSLYRNNSSPGSLTTNSFVAAADMPCGSNSDTIAAVDVDGDGLLDLVAGSVQTYDICVYRNLGIGTLSTNSFAPKVSFGLGYWTHTVAVADFNGDSKPDITVVGELPSVMSVFQNNSTPGSFTSSSFGSRLDFGTGWNAWGVVAGDLDGDGRPDIVFCNAYDSTVTIYQNQLPFGTPPVIVSQSGSQIVTVNTTVQLTANVTGKAPLSWQWYCNGTNLADGGRITGATSSILTITNAQVADSGDYYFIVTNSVGAATGAVATVSVTVVPPSFPQPPQNQLAFLGGNATFTANVAGSQPLSLLWFSDNGVLSDGGRISGSTTSALTITGVQTNDTVNYWLVASNLAGMATSSVASRSKG